MRGPLNRLVAAFRNKQKIEQVTGGVVMVPDPAVRALMALARATAVTGKTLTIDEPTYDPTARERAVLAALTVWFGSTEAIAATGLPGYLVDLLIGVGIDRRVAEEIGELTATPQLTGRTRYGSPPPIDGMTVLRMVASEEPEMRARYVLAACRRLTEALGAEDYAQEAGQYAHALGKERRYLAQHVGAGRNRRAAAKRVDEVAKTYPYLVWRTMRDSRVEGRCRALEGRVFTADNLPDGQIPGAVHPRCFPAGVVASGPAALAGTSRWYDGELVEIRTAFGHVLPVTPNHPILTPQGWTPAGNLVHGSYVVRDRGLKSMAVGDPYDYQGPVLIEDIARTLGRAGRVMPGRVPMTPEDFHGDGSYGEVDVVRPDGFLRNWLEIAQPLANEALRRACTGDVALTRARNARTVLDALALPTDGVVGSFRVGGALFGGSSGGHRAVGVGLSTQRNALLLEPFSQSGSGNTQGARDRLNALTAHVTLDHDSTVSGYPALVRASDRDVLFSEYADDHGTGYALGLSQAREALASFVAPDQVVEIRRYPFSGHVYNLETSGGWYTANDLIVHNCRCRAESWGTPLWALNRN